MCQGQSLGYVLLLDVTWDSQVKRGHGNPPILPLSDYECIYLYIYLYTIDILRMSLAQTPLKELLSQRRVRGLLAAAGHSGAAERSARGLRAWGELSPVGSLFSKLWPGGA